MPRNFLPYDQDQLFLMPPALSEWVAEGSLARFVSEMVEELDGRGELGSFYERYREDGWGRAAYHPCMMVKVILYGYALGVRSSRKLAWALDQDVGFRYLAANQRPDFRTISDFRKENLAGLDGLFVQVLELCTEAGLVGLGRVALDGRRVAGSASIMRNKARSELEALVRQILQEAEEVDAAEDELYGKDRRGDELPEELQDPAQRKKRIREALAAIEKRKKELENRQDERIRAWDEKKAEGKAKGRRPRPMLRQREREQLERLRINTTDPDSRPLTTRRGWIQGYNGQAMVDCETQIIVAQDLTHEADDRGHLPLMLQRVEEQAGARPRQCLADTGYWSEANASLSDERTELFIAVQREAEMRGYEYGRKQVTRTRPEADRMRKKLSTPEGREIYKSRSRSVEPVFGQMYMRDLNRILLRGLGKARAEWSLWCTTHNLLKLWRSGASLRPV